MVEKMVENYMVTAILSWALRFALINIFEPFDKGV